jgi:hypothetical protein
MTGLHYHTEPPSFILFVIENTCLVECFLNFLIFLFIFLVVLGFELRPLRLLGKPPALKKYILFRCFVTVQMCYVSSNFRCTMIMLVAATW